MVNNEKMEEYFNLGIFLLAMIFAVISIFSLYSALGVLIVTWIDYKYKPIFDIAFNLSVLIVCIYLIREKLIRK